MGASVHKCKSCSILLPDANPFDRCSACQRTYGRVLRENLRFSICETCGVSVDSSVRKHNCISPLEVAKNKIEKDIKQGYTGQQTIEAMWQIISDLSRQVQDLRDRLDNKEITEDIVPLMQQWEEQLGGQKSLRQVPAEEEAER